MNFKYRNSDHSFNIGEPKFTEPLFVAFKRVLDGFGQTIYFNEIVSKQETNPETDNDMATAKNNIELQSLPNSENSYLILRKIHLIATPKISEIENLTRSDIESSNNFAAKTLTEVILKQEKESGLEIKEWVVWQRNYPLKQITQNGALYRHNGDSPDQLRFYELKPDRGISSLDECTPHLIRLVYAYLMADKKGFF